MTCEAHIQIMKLVFRNEMIYIFVFWWMYDLINMLIFIMGYGLMLFNVTYCCLLGYWGKRLMGCVCSMHMKFETLHSSFFVGLVPDWFPFCGKNKQKQMWNTE